MLKTSRERSLSRAVSISYLTRAIVMSRASRVRWWYQRARAWVAAPPPWVPDVSRRLPAALSATARHRAGAAACRDLVDRFRPPAARPRHEVPSCLALARSCTPASCHRAAGWFRCGICGSSWPERAGRINASRPGRPQQESLETEPAGQAERSTMLNDHPSRPSVQDALFWLPSMTVVVKRAARVASSVRQRWSVSMSFVRRGADVDTSGAPAGRGACAGRGGCGGGRWRG
jgi:hypothetical protein